MTQIDATEAKLQTHEEVCTLRYAAIEKCLAAGDKRMTRIEYLIYIVIAAVLMGPGFAAEFLKKLF